MKMFSVPNVVMKGGSFTLVTSTPLSRPAAVPTAKPRIRASQPGTPLSVAAFAMNIELKTMMAPIDRSMPAVRMMRV